MKIGHTIRKLRIDKGFSQSGFAEIIQISGTSLCQIERNKKHPGQATLHAIANALEVPEGYIYILSMDEKDFPENKRRLFREFQPIIELMITKIMHQ